MNASSKIDRQHWERLLDQWGAWRLGGLGFGIGIGAIYQRYRPREIDPVDRSAPDLAAFDRQMHDVDRAMALVRDSDRPVYQALLVRHTLDEPSAVLARVCRCAVSTYYARIDRGYRLLGYVAMSYRVGPFSDQVRGKPAYSAARVGERRLHETCRR